MPNIQELACKMNTEVINGLKKSASAVPADKQTWSPLDQGRTVVNQIAECALITSFVASTISGQAMPEFDGAAYEAGMAGLNTLDAAIAALDTSAAELNAAISEFPTDELDTKITMPWFEEPQSFTDIFFIAYWNNTYHIGQINYIQTLYGDKEMH